MHWVLLCLSCIHLLVMRVGGCRPPFPPSPWVGGWRFCASPRAVRLPRRFPRGCVAAPPGRRSPWIVAAVGPSRHAVLGPPLRRPRGVRACFPRALGAAPCAPAALAGAGLPVGWVGSFCWSGGPPCVRTSSSVARSVGRGRLPCRTGSAWRWPAGVVGFFAAASGGQRSSPPSRPPPLGPWPRGGWFWLVWGLRVPLWGRRVLSFSLCASRRGGGSFRLVNRMAPAGD